MSNGSVEELKISLEPDLEPSPTRNAHFDTSQRPLSLPRSDIHCSTFKGQSPLHGLIDAVHQAFSNHSTLILKPDDFWQIATSEVGRYIDVNAKALRKDLVPFEGKMTLKVREDSLEMGKVSAEQWQDIFSRWVPDIQRNMKVSLPFDRSFSTSSALHRFCCNVTLMSAVKNYFQYSLETLCGIPHIILRGTKKDWEELVEGVKAFLNIAALKGIHLYLKRFVEIVEQMERYRNGTETNPSFLKNIYRYNSGEGSGSGPQITGWIGELFYLGMDNKPLEDLSYGQRVISTAVLPSGITRVPFVWQYLGKEYPMVCYAGFDGPLVDEQNRTIESRMAFVVANDSKALL